MTVTEEANYVLSTFYSNLTFVWRLRNSKNENSPLVKTLHLLYKNNICVPANVSKNSGSLINYDRLGIGGTGAMAVGQLARWIRGLTRLPIHTWEYWASPPILLGCTNSTEMLLRIKQSTYGDSEATKCVLCGGDKSGDWWCLYGIVGPCCSLNKCLGMRKNEK